LNELFTEGWRQILIMKKFTEASGTLQPQQIRYLRIWPRIACPTSTDCECTWNPGVVQELEPKMAPPPSKSDAEQCPHNFTRSLCTTCRPELVKTETVFTQPSVDVRITGCKDEPPGLDVRINVLCKSIQMMVGDKVVVRVYINDTLFHTQEPV